MNNRISVRNPLLKYKSNLNFEMWFNENYQYLRRLFEIANNELRKNNRSIPEKEFVKMCSIIYKQS